METPVEDHPLAMCDGSTVPDKDLIAIDHVRRTYVGESYYPLHSEDMRWYYLSNQTKDEALIMKMYDSKEDVPARCIVREL